MKHTITIAWLTMMAAASTVEAQTNFEILSFQFLTTNHVTRKFTYRTPYTNNSQYVLIGKCAIEQVGGSGLLVFRGTNANPNMTNTLIVNDTQQTCNPSNKFYRLQYNPGADLTDGAADGIELVTNAIIEELEGPVSGATTNEMQPYIDAFLDYWHNGNNFMYHPNDR